MKISAIVNTLNEEENIEACLQSLDWCDEIVVVDMYSEDKTVEIAQRFTDKIFYHPKMGYVEPARQFALDHTTGDWIFVLDADERVPASLAEKLKEIAEANAYEIVAIPRRNYILGRWIRHGGNYPDYQARFFQRGRLTFGSQIHHANQLHGKVHRLPKSEPGLIHFSYTDLNSLLSRLIKYTDVEAKHLQEKNTEFSLLCMLLHSLRRFFNYYILKRGFLDGIPGLVVCLNASLYRFYTYIKLWEKNQADFKESYRFIDAGLNGGKNSAEK